MTRSLVAAIQAVWRTLSTGTIADDLEGEAGARILDAVVGGQLTVAEGAQAYVREAMAAQEGSGVPEALLVAEAFTGVAPDGGPLDTLLYLPAIGVQRRLTAGMSPDEAMLGGLADMARYAATAVSDTARSATQVAMAADRQCVAYTRIVQLPACARCIILAGQQYSYSEGFLRHPNCDCLTVPLRRGEWAGVDGPEDLYGRMSEAERRRVFTVAGAEALEAGADMGQVVNARRGMSEAHVHGRRLQVTSEGTTKRGLYGRRVRRAGGEFARTPGQRYMRAQTPRLTPEEVFRVADDRAEQLRLLRRYGYIV
ncbi:VG15 protein [Streptomyces smyrnaeus]|uniref:VG15 protein n=1 Tax=Streptomyces smyrnaeus TaxID=1387713 RepID=UPI0034064A99